MQLRSRAWLVLLALVLAVPVVMATGVGPAAAIGVPHITSVTPNHAYVGYSFPITISGSNLTGTTSVDFNEVVPRVAESFVVVDDSTITAMTPALGTAYSGTTVSVTSSGGTSNAVPFTWTFTPPAPVITAITPGTGQVDGGDPVAITGNFVNSGTTVTFGGLDAVPFAGHGSGEIDVTSPAHAAGAVDVVLTTDGGPTTVVGGFTYIDPAAPTVSAVNPNLGRVAGGTTVTITGTNFVGATDVMFGTSVAPMFMVNSSTSITATSPPHAPLPVDITVVTPDGTSSAVGVDTFFFGGVPAVSGVHPGVGVVAGGTSVTITGTSFNAATAVMFGSTAATSFTVDSDTSITATSPPHAIATVDVTVVGPFGTSPPTGVDGFSFEVPSPPPLPPPPPAPPASTCCRMATRAGEMFAAGDAHLYGSLQGRVLRAPVVGLASNPSGNGYWLVSSDGGVFAFGDARFVGSMSGAPLNAPIVAMTATSDGGGYWLAAADGGVFAFGDARFAGSMSGAPLNAPIVGIAASANGYLLVGADGGVFAFGGASMFGSMGGVHVNAPIVGIVATREGYLLAGSDGGVFAFGGASMFGSMSQRTNGRVIVGIGATANGYLLATRDGVRFAFTAGAPAVESSTPVDAPIVGIG